MGAAVNKDEVLVFRTTIGINKLDHPDFKDQLQLTTFLLFFNGSAHFFGVAEAFDRSREVLALVADLEGVW